MKNESVLKVWLFFLVSLVGANANAGYDCKSEDGRARLTLSKVNPDSHSTGYSVVVNATAYRLSFNAELQTEETSTLYSKHQYILRQPSSVLVEAMLTIVSRVKVGGGRCGRAGCDSYERIISAKLEYKGENGVDFNCVETIEPKI